LLLFWGVGRVITRASSTRSDSRGGLLPQPGTHWAWPNLFGPPGAGRGEEAWKTEEEPDPIRRPPRHPPWRRRDDEMPPPGGGLPPAGVITGGPFEQPEPPRPEIVPEFGEPPPVRPRPPRARTISGHPYVEQDQGSPLVEPVPETPAPQPGRPIPPPIRQGGGVIQGGYRGRPQPGGYRGRIGTQPGGLPPPPTGQPGGGAPAHGTGQQSGSGLSAEPGETADGTQFGRDETWREHYRRRRWPYAGTQDEKMAKVMREFEEGKLRSGSKHGPKVKKRSQAIAIGLKQSGQSRNSHQGYQADDQEVRLRRDCPWLFAD
jgi:hypothetical protein